MSSPYPISGTIIKSDGTAYEGVYISLKNMTADEWIKGEGIVTSSSNGQYIIDAGNLPSGYSNGDKLLIVYYIGDYREETFHTIDTNIGSWENDITIYEIEDLQRVGIVQMINQFGNWLNVIEVVRNLNDRGDSTDIETKHSIKGAVTIMDGSEELVREGILEKEDIIVFFDLNEDNIIYLETGNRIEYDGKMYNITNVIKNAGHWEVQAKKQ